MAAISKVKWQAPTPKAHQHRPVTPIGTKTFKMISVYWIVLLYYAHPIPSKTYIWRSCIHFFYEIEPKRKPTARDVYLYPYRTQQPDWSIRALSNREYCTTTGFTLLKCLPGVLIGMLMPCIAQPPPGKNATTTRKNMSDHKRMFLPNKLRVSILLARRITSKHDMPAKLYQALVLVSTIRAPPIGCRE